MWLIKLWLRWAFKRSAYQILMGRYHDRAEPSSGRFTRVQVDELLKSVWAHLDSLLPEANLEQYKTLGNRQNVYLAIATRAAYHAFLEAGIEFCHFINWFQFVTNILSYIDFLNIQVAFSCFLGVFIL